MKAVVAAFNQEKALDGAFSVITNLRVDLRLKLYCSEVVPKCRGSLAPRIVSGAGHLQHCSTVCRYPHHHPHRHLLHSDPLHTGQLTPDIVSTTGGYILVLCPFIRIPKLPTFELRFLYIFFILPAGCAVHNSGCQRSEPPVATNYPKIRI